MMARWVSCAKFVGHLGCGVRSAADCQQDGALAAFLCLFRRMRERTTAHVEDKVINDGLWKREIKCVGLNAMDADLRIPI